MRQLPTHLSTSFCSSISLGITTSYRFQASSPNYPVFFSLVTISTKFNNRTLAYPQFIPPHPSPHSHQHLISYQANFQLSVYNHNPSPPLIPTPISNLSYKALKYQANIKPRDPLHEKPPTGPPKNATLRRRTYLRNPCTYLQIPQIYIYKQARKHAQRSLAFDRSILILHRYIIRIPLHHQTF